ncbi:MAG: tol-pal system protein YbgF [Deltaproteobacteria bacterium]|nr:MAG: tol-pal system protein YbgF [Deltaproteobacteria bacterium]
MNRLSFTHMVKRLLGLGLLKLLLLCFFLGGCATQKDVSLLQRQIWTARRDLDKSKAQMAEMEKTLDEKLVALDADRQPLRKNQAEVGAQLDRIELELGRLSGQLEEASEMNKRNGERISEVQQNQMESMLEVRKNVEDLQRALNVMAGHLGLQELAVTSKPSSQKERQPAKALPPSDSGQSAKKQPPANAQEHYDNALNLFRSGQYDEARSEFVGYLEKYPKSNLADNAQFWLGECYYADKRYGEAIAAYEKTIKEYPKSDKVSSAMLKQGMAFIELGDNTAGKILLKRVVKEYPSSNQAKIAQSKLNRTK